MEEYAYVAYGMVSLYSLVTLFLACRLSSRLYSYTRSILQCLTAIYHCMLGYYDRNLLAEVFLRCARSLTLLLNEEGSCRR